MNSTTQTIDEAAAQWAVRLSAGSLLPQEQQNLDEWLALRPQHQGALVRARALWTDLDRLAALSSGLAPAVSPSPVDPVEAKAAANRWLLAASVAVMAILTAAWFSLSARTQTYVSAVGEIRRISLADGSNIVLNTASEARVHFTDEGREVRLTRGEALFEVAKNPSRPFVVRANGFTVKAVGTAFSVRVGVAEVDVTVTEGVVEVARQDASTADAPRRVSAQQHVVAKRPKSELEIHPIAPTEIDRQLAWRQGMVAFDGESLYEAVAEINRHSRRQLAVDDATLGARPVVGLFRANDAESFAQAAAETFDAELVDNGGSLHLRPKS